MLIGIVLGVTIGLAIAGFNGRRMRRAAERAQKMVARLEQLAL